MTRAHTRLCGGVSRACDDIDRRKSTPIATPQRASARSRRTEQCLLLVLRRPRRLDFGHVACSFRRCKGDVRVSCRVQLLLPIAALVVALPGFAQAQATPPAPSPQAPLPNRLNEVMPTWLRVRAEFRERVEGFESAGFVPDRDDSYYLSRFRLNATVTPSKLLSFQAQVQDSRVADKSIGPTTAPFRGPFDLRLGFAQVGNAKSPLTVQAGRI